MSETRSSKWTFLFYKKSVPKNYKSILDEIHVPYMLSPWHDKDIDSETGELKKAHKHGVLYFESLKSRSQVVALLKPLEGPKYIEVVHSEKGMYDYFTHAENPEKAQYNIEDIEYGCGFDLTKFLANQNTVEMVKEVLKLVEENNITEFNSLINLTKEIDNPSMLELLVSRAYFFSKYLDSRRYQQEKMRRKRVDR